MFGSEMYREILVSGTYVHAIQEHMQTYLTCGCGSASDHVALIVFPVGL